MSEMIERVAAAILAEQQSNRSAFPSNLDLARAAIKAMRDPTAEMLYFGVGNKDARLTWNLMIDAATKP